MLRTGKPAAKTISRRSFLKVSASAGIAAVSGCATSRVTTRGAHKKTNSRVVLTNLEKRIVEGKLSPPVATTKENNNSGNCAGYAREVANKYCGMHYTPSPAWAFGKKHKIVYQVQFGGSVRRRIQLDDIEKFIENGTLKRGMLLGCYYGNSPANSANRNYTHLVVYLGKNNGEPVFAHNFHGPELTTLKMLFDPKNKLSPVCIISDK